MEDYYYRDYKFEGKDYRKLLYPGIPLGTWRWEQNYGFRVRFLQLVSWALRMNAFIFQGHKPVSDAAAAGYDQLSVLVEFSKQEQF